MRRCCERTFCPLTLCYAKTIDTFQGQNAGPVDDGKPPNAIQCLVCDPGDRTFEARKPSIFYTMLSRATTLGNLKDHKRLDSAIYFYDFGLNTTMTASRIVNLRESNITGRTYAAIRKRDTWMEYLKKHENKRDFEEKEIQRLFTWAETTKVEASVLDKLLASFRWRTVTQHTI
jgi:hypothetical protein